MSNYCLDTGMACQYANEFGYCSITACRRITETAKWNHVHSLKYDIVPIASTPRSFEEILAEETNIQKVIDVLEECGVQIKTKYGYYRDTYDVLKDIGEHWNQIKIKLKG